MSFLPPSDVYVRSFLFLFYTLVKLCYIKSPSNQASSLAPDGNPLLWRPRILVSSTGHSCNISLSTHIFCSRFLSSLTTPFTHQAGQNLQVILTPLSSLFTFKKLEDSDDINCWMSLEYRLHCSYLWKYPNSGSIISFLDYCKSLLDGFHALDCVSYSIQLLQWLFFQRKNIEEEKENLTIVTSMLKKHDDVMDL